MRVPPSAHRPAAEDRVPSSTFASSSTSRGRRTAPDRRAEHAVFHGENTVETSFFTVNVQVACGAILAKTRVRASAEKMPHCTRPSEPLSSTSRWGWTACSYEIASARLVGYFYPYGQEKPSATTNGTEKFTGYFRDAETGLDYAKKRFHNPGTGRFLTPDHSAAGAPNAPTLTGNWNQYAYVGADPINRTDPRGLCSIQDNPPCYSTDVTSSQLQGSTAGLFEVVDGPDSLTDDSNDGQTADGPAGMTQAQIIASAEGLVDQWLENPNCAGLFGTPSSRAGGWNPTTVVNSLLTTGTYTSGGSTISSAREFWKYLN